MKQNRNTSAPGQSQIFNVAAICVVTSFFLNLLILVSPIFMMQVFDRVVPTGHVDTLIYLLIMAAGAFLVFGILDGSRQAILARSGCWLERTLAPRLLEASFAATLRGNQLGAQPLRDLATCRGFLSGHSVSPFLDAPWAPLFMALIWLLHPILGVLALGGAVVLGCLALLNEALTRRTLREGTRIAARAQMQADSLLRNAEVVQSMGLMSSLVARWRTPFERSIEYLGGEAERSGRILATSKAIRQALQVGMLGLGGYLVINNELTAGGMIAASILMGRALAPVEQGIGGWRAYRTARDAWQRVASLLAASGALESPMSLPSPEGRLSIEGVTYTPLGAGEAVLKRVSFAMEPGEVLIVVGPSGAGKSTLCRLLTGIFPPNGGHVRLDGAEVSSFNRQELGPHIGYLPQNVELFDGTIAENVARMGKPDAEKVVVASKLAGVHDLVLRLDCGYDTEIGEQGARLSGGQRQRVALARALYGDPQLLVLDEPAASLDHIGKDALERALRAVANRGTTVVMVSHDPRALRVATKALVLNRGVVEAFGSPEEVFRREVKPLPEQSSSEQSPGESEDCEESAARLPNTNHAGTPGA